MSGCTEVSSHSELPCSSSPFGPWIPDPVDTSLLCWWSGQKSCASSLAAFAGPLCPSRRAGSVLSAWISESRQHCAADDHCGSDTALNLLQRVRPSMGEAVQGLWAGAAQQCYCKAVKPCTIPFTGAFPLTLAIIKLHYENTLWSSRDSPVLWHPGSRRHLAASRVLAGLEALGRSRYCRECPASITAAFGAGWAGQGWIPEQRLVPLAWTHGDLWMDQRTTAGVCQEPPRQSFGFGDVGCFLTVAFLHPFVFWLEYELSIILHVLLVVKSPQICRQPYIKLILWVMLTALSPVWHMVQH